MSHVDDACARWIALSDRRALGEPLSTPETTFLHEHGPRCETCRREAEIWRELEALVDAPETVEPAPHRRRWPWVTGAVAIAAALLLAVRPARHDEPSAPPRTAEPALATVVLQIGAGVVFEVDGRPASDGDRVDRGHEVAARRGAACLVVEPNIRACIDQGSVVRVLELGAHRRLELRSGRVAVELDPLPSDRSFGIDTDQGSVIAIGTAFSVEKPPGDAPVVTRVMHGRVLVRSTDGGEQRVAAHERTSMRDAAPSALPAADEERQRALLVPSHDDEATSARADAAAPEPATSAVAAAKSASELLIAIRERHAKGELDGAVAAYRELFERHRGSAQAHAALVPWGDLQLTRLDDANGALASFDRYLARGGALEEEALFGRVRALRALGRHQDERAAIEALLRRSPDGPLAPSLDARLRALDAR